MKVRLKHEWLGNREGEVLDLIEPAARALIERETAEGVSQDMPPASLRGKIMRSPNDKMSRGSRNK